MNEGWQLLSDDDKLELIFKRYSPSDFKKFWKQLKLNHIEVNKKEAKHFFELFHQKRYVKKYNKSLMGNKFSSIRDAWQMDIYFIGSKYTTDEKIHNYLLLININTKFAWIKRIESKKYTDVISALNEFIDEFKPKVIECDEDASFLSKSFIESMEMSDIVLKAMPHDYKDYLSVIDKFCVTLNSKVYRGEIDRKEMDLEESADIDYENSENDIEVKQFDKYSTEPIAVDQDVEEIVDKYNDTYNYAIKMTPREMQNDENAELKYIFKQFRIRDYKDKLRLKSELKIGDKVRYILDADRKERKFEKGSASKELSQYYYKVCKQVTPYLYEIIAKDGSTKAIPRFRLYKVNSSKNIEWSPTIEQETYSLGYKPQWFYDKILDYNYKNKEYQVRRVQYTKTGRNVRKEWLKIYDFRRRFGILSKLNKLEIDFLHSHSDEYKYDKEKNLIVIK